MRKTSQPPSNSFRLAGGTRGKVDVAEIIWCPGDRGMEQGGMYRLLLQVDERLAGGWHSGHFINEKEGNLRCVASQASDARDKSFFKQETPGSNFFCHKLEPLFRIHGIKCSKRTASFKNADEAGDEFNGVLDYDANNGTFLKTSGAQTIGDMVGGRFKLGIREALITPLDGHVISMLFSNFI